MPQDWFVVQCNPQREGYAAENLIEHQTYFPQFKNPAGRIRPLFPSYLFVVATPYWSEIKNALGVRTILMNGDKPAKLPNEVIASWRDREQNGLVQLPPAPRFRQGERLVVMRGTLRHRVVIHTGMSSQDREAVLIDMLGAMVKINIATDDLVSEAERHARNSLRARRETLMRQRRRSF
jgi:transcriptional antiterminator RfaH